MGKDKYLLCFQYASRSVVKASLTTTAFSLDVYKRQEVNLTKAQMYDYAHRMFIAKNKFYDVSSKSNLMKIVLNNIYTCRLYTSEKKTYSAFLL